VGAFEPGDSVLFLYAPAEEIASAELPEADEIRRLAILVPAFAAEASDAALVEHAGSLVGAPGLPGDPPVPIFGRPASWLPVGPREAIDSVERIGAFAATGAAGATALARVVAFGVRRLVFGFDLLANVFLHLSRLEETLTAERDRDRFGRFPSGRTILARDGALRCPPADRLAAHLAALIVRESAHPCGFVARRALWPGGETSAILLSHDVDQSVSWPRRLARDVGDVARALGRVRPRAAAAAAVRAARHLAPAQRDPALFPRAVHAFERREKVRSSWYFLAVPSDAEGRRYRVASAPFARLLREIAAAGGEIGLHGSIQASRDAAAMGAERALLERVLGAAVAGNRQHYLTLFAPQSFRDLASAGLSHDSSVGYSDAAGFRAGTSLPFLPYDVPREATVDLLEIPLAVMDVALIKPGDPSIDLDPLWRELLDRQAAIGGLLTVLWHPRMFDAETHPAGRAPYEALVRAGRERALPFVTSGAVAAWWRAREGIALVGHETVGRETALRYETAAALDRATIVLGYRAETWVRTEARGVDFVERSGTAIAPRVTIGGVRAGGTFEVRVTSESAAAART
jgi:hypothetical protein